MHYVAIFSIVITLVAHCYNCVRAPPIVLLYDGPVEIQQVLLIVNVYLENPISILNTFETVTSLADIRSRNSDEFNDKIRYANSRFKNETLKYSDNLPGSLSQSRPSRQITWFLLGTFFSNIFETTLLNIFGRSQDPLIQKTDT